MKRISWLQKSAVGLAIVTLVGSLVITTSAMVMPPPGGGDGIEQLYVDNVIGSDENDGSEEAPLRTLAWAFQRMNVSGAPRVEMYVRGTYLPYTITGGLGFKRNNVSVQSWGDRHPFIEGVITKGSWNLPDLALDSVTGVHVSDLDLHNVAIDFYATPSGWDDSVYDVVLSSINIKVDQAELLSDEDQPVIWFHNLDYSGSGNRALHDIKLDRVMVGMVNEHGEAVDAVRLEDIEGLEVYRSAFYGIGWDTGIEVINSENVRLAENEIEGAAREKLGLYSFDDVEDTTVYNRV